MFGEDFYPTPRSVANRMVALLSKDAENILWTGGTNRDLPTPRLP